VDPDEAWAAHLCNVAELRNYASAMHQLATRYWPERDGTADSLSNCRISWIAGAISNYFHGGGREKQRAKDAKRLARYRSLQPHIVDNVEKNCEDSSVETECYARKSDPNMDFSSRIREDCAVAASKLSSSAKQNIEEDSEPMGGLSSCDDVKSDRPPKLKVLDVGSCFNPFQQFRYGV
jgi:hypothetical protein